jgi:hypothetical protein
MPGTVTNVRVIAPTMKIAAFVCLLTKNIIKQQANVNMIAMAFILISDWEQ